MKSVFLATSLFAPLVLADCAGFDLLSGVWEDIGSNTTGYEWLYAPVYQVSTWTTCTEDQYDTSCNGALNQCVISPNAQLSLFPRYNETPSFPSDDPEAPERFFQLVLDTVRPVKEESTPHGFPISEPLYHACGNLTEVFEGKTNVYYKACLNPGEHGWLQYIPYYQCVTGITRNCTDGPYESDTQVTVCASRKAGLRDGYVTANREETITDKDGKNYTVKYENPNLSTDEYCPTANAGVLGVKLNMNSLVFVTLTVMAGFLC